MMERADHIDDDASCSRRSVTMRLWPEHTSVAVIGQPIR
jgi:hypothetical protein